MVNKSESIIELAKSLAKFQGEVKQPKKDGVNPHFKSNFVTLDGVVEAITTTASKHGLSFLQFPLNEDDKVGVKTLIMHESGEWIEGEPVFTRPMKNDPQALGAVLTYLRRYSLSAIFGISADVDDDAEGAMDRTQAPKNNYNAPAQSSSNTPYTSKIKMPTTAQEAALIEIGFGKHKGKTLKQLWTEDNQYILWLLGSEKTDPSIREGIELMQVAAAQSEIKKKMQ